MLNNLLKSVPNTISLLNMSLGIISILIITRTDITNKATIVFVLVSFGGILDVLDGYTAKKLNAFSDVGKQLDSFADIVTFGIAPIALTAYFFGDVSLILLIFISLVYIFSAVYRLVRFNLSDPSRYFQGLPITAAGILLVAYFAVCAILSYQKNMFFTLIFVLALSAMMVSKVKIKRVF